MPLALTVSTDKQKLGKVSVQDIIRFSSRRFNGYYDEAYLIRAGLKISVIKTKKVLI